jgi:hypothetical protein
VAWPLAARAQQSDRMRRIGVLMSLAADDKEGQARLNAFVQSLQELGWTEGRPAWTQSACISSRRDTSVPGNEMAMPRDCNVRYIGATGRPPPGKSHI